MTDRELKHSVTIVRNWLIEIGPTLPIHFTHHIAIVAGTLAERLKKEEDNANLDHQRHDK